MKTTNQLTFTTYEASLKLNPRDPIKIILIISTGLLSTAWSVVDIRPRGQGATTTMMPPGELKAGTTPSSATKST